MTTKHIFKNAMLHFNQIRDKVVTHYYPRTQENTGFIIFTNPAFIEFIKGNFPKIPHSKALDDLILLSVINFVNSGELIDTLPQNMKTKDSIIFSFDLSVKQLSQSYNNVNNEANSLDENIKYELRRKLVSVYLNDAKNLNADKTILYVNPRYKMNEVVNTEAPPIRNNK